MPLFFIAPTPHEGRRKIPQDRNTILIVDDTPEHLALVSSLLRRAGFHILTAVNAREGIRVARSERPNLVISDVVMPNISGIELCRMIRADADLATMIPAVELTTRRRNKSSTHSSRPKKLTKVPVLACQWFMESLSSMTVTLTSTASWDMGEWHTP